MKEYDDETLHHVQRLELMILKDFIKVCTEHNLTYFAYAGTGLGALRHKGFIPWDDDIDVCLPAADHDKVLRIFEEQYSDKYEVINAQKNPQYPLPTSRIMIKGTQFCEEALRDLPLDLGIFWTCIRLIRLVRARRPSVSKLVALGSGHTCVC